MRKVWARKIQQKKILADYNDVFADIINGLVFKGEQKVTPESLENISTRSVYKGRKNKLHEQERDIVKLWKERDIEFAIYAWKIKLYRRNICRFVY